MSIYVFVGPSLAVSEAAQILDVTYLPPVAMGDVLRVLSRKPKMIAIIDGVFETSPSVWHKEILFALSQGVHVLGAASMGAIRAAELHTFGMVGVGRIFESYRDGQLDADDEVAVIHSSSEQGYRACSDALVNIREGLNRAVTAGILSKASAERLLTQQKGLFYPDRSWSLLLASGEAAQVDESQMAALRIEFPRAPNLKQEDARELLELMRDTFRDGISPHVPNFDFEPTYYWNGLVALENVARADADADWAPNVALSRHLRLTHPRRRELLNQAILSFLLYHEAKRCGVLPSTSEAGDLDWLRGTIRSLPPEVDRFNKVIDQLKEQLVTTLDARLDFFVAAELARSGELDTILGEVRRKFRILRSHGFAHPRLTDLRIDLGALSDWYELRFGKLATTGDAHAKALGFATWEEFIGEVILEYMASSV